jgi:hypothetical protein
MCFSGIIGAMPSIGSPRPLKTLPNISFDTPTVATSPVGTTAAPSVSIPEVPSRTCMTARSPLSWSIWPVLFSPFGRVITHISPSPPPVIFPA